VKLPFKSLHNNIGTELANSTKSKKIKVFHAYWKSDNLINKNYLRVKPYLINVLNALVLISLGSWAYISSITPSITALIPVLAGIILIAITPSFRKGNRVFAHIAVTLTFLILLGLIKPLAGAIGRADTLGVARVVIMMGISLVAMVIFVKSFIDARRGIKK